MAKFENIEVAELYTTENDNDPIVKIHFTNPNGRGDWFVTEGKMESNGDWLFFGFVRSPLVPEYDEFGYFTLNELKSAGIVKDTAWDSKPLSEAKNDALAIDALEAIILDSMGVSGAFIHQLCIGARNIVTVGEVLMSDDYVHGSHENQNLSIEKIGLIRLWDLISQLM